MEKIIKLLHEGGYSCVISNNGAIRTFVQRGVADLYTLLKNDPIFLKDALIADKVVGKAAASLMVLGNIGRLYTHVISLSALMLLQKAGVKVDFGKLVPVIENRDQSDWCPLERICYYEEKPENILILIENFLQGKRTDSRAGSPFT